MIHSFCVVSDNSIIGLEEIPWIPDSNPATMSLDDSIFPLRNIKMNKICDFSFSSWRERKLLKIYKNLVIKLMIANIREISQSRIFWLFDDSCCFFCRIGRENPKITWFFDLFAESSVSFTFCEIHDIILFVEIISRNNDKFSSYFSLECQYGCASSIFFSLSDVLDRLSEIVLTEIFSEFLGFVFYDHKNTVEIRDDFLNIVFDDCFSTDFDEWFWSCVCEWPHTRSLSSCENDEVHIYFLNLRNNCTKFIEYIWFVKKNPPILVD